jgi:hypothetical protein
VNGEFGDGRPQGHDHDDAIADALRWGLAAEEIDAVRAALDSPAGERLWAMHVRAFAALCAAGTQWRRRLIATEQGFREICAGLDYAGLKVALDALQLSLTPDEFRQLGVLERAATAAMNGEPAP